jgi:hypothetical protein
MRDLVDCRTLAYVSIRSHIIVMGSQHADRTWSIQCGHNSPVCLNVWTDRAKIKPIERMLLINFLTRVFLYRFSVIYSMFSFWFIKCSGECFSLSCKNLRDFPPIILQAKQSVKFEMFFKFYKGNSMDFSYSIVIYGARNKLTVFYFRNFINETTF